MGGGFSSIFGLSQDSSDYLQLTDLGSFLCKYIFLMLDKEKKNRISKHEYLTLVNHFRAQKTSENELDDFLQAHASFGQSTEYIDEILFKKLIIHLAIDFEKNVSDRMTYLMTLFDKGNDGFVCENDLSEVYSSIGIQVPLEPVRCLIQRYDLDGDNKLSKIEFENLGKSAMSKLFIKRDPSLEEILVEEAIRKGSASLTSAGDGVTSRDINNNNTDGLVRVDGIILGKPIEVIDPSCVFTKAYLSDLEISGECGDSLGSLEGILSELQLD